MGILEQIASSHFSSTQGGGAFLSAVQKELRDATLPEFLACENLLVRQATGRWIHRQRQTEATRTAVTTALTSEAPLRAGALIVLSGVQPPLAWPGLVRQILSNLEHSDAAVRLAAARCIAFRYAEHASALLPLCRDPRTAAEGLTLACYSQNPGLIQPLLDVLADKRRLPPAFGFLLSPTWLAQQAIRAPETVTRLALEFGYIDGELTPDAVPLLRAGFMFVPRAVPAAGDVELWQARISAFNWRLLPQELGLQKTATLDIDSDLDRDLFVAAVRAADMLNLQLEKERNPFTYRARESTWTAKFFFAAASYCRRKLLDEARREADKLALPVAHVGEYVLDRARCLLEADEEHQVENEMLLQARWRSVARGHPCAGLPCQVPLTDAEYPGAKFAVLDAARLASGPAVTTESSRSPIISSVLSPGATAVVNLAHYLGMAAEVASLAESERIHGAFLVPAGIELQIPMVGAGTTFAWKQALRHFGIPSPRRPEYKTTVEAAFRPARSYHGLMLAPMLIAKLGIPATEQDAALHLSIQGDLGPDVRYLALPLLLLKRSRRGRTSDARLHESMARLMSKGFVNRNNDVEQVPGAPPAVCRTELRMFGCIFERQSGQMVANPAYGPLIAAAHLLASTALCERPEAEAIWADYKAAVTQAVTALPPEFNAMLEADWYQATGDPRDGRLVALLPIMQRYVAMRQVLEVSSLGPQITTTLSALLDAYARRVYAQFIPQSEAFAG